MYDLARKALGLILIAAAILLNLRCAARPGAPPSGSVSETETMPIQRLRPVLRSGHAAGLMFRFWLKKFFGS